MTNFEAALDDAFDELEAKLGRLPNSDEEAELRDGLFRSWAKSARFDELIEYVQDYYELEGGFGDTSILSEALKQAGDLARIEKLYEGLLKARSKAFSKVWSQAQAGNIGPMRESAKHMAAIMEAYAGLYHGYWSLQNEPGMAKVKAEMLHFQTHRTEQPRPKRSRSDA
jgi:hypothetical protein